MSHSHFELDENFNFIEEGEKVANEEIVALEFDPNNIFIVRPELLILKQAKLVLLFQLSIQLLPPNDKEHRLFGHVLVWKNVKTKKVKWWMQQCANFVKML